MESTTTEPIDMKEVENTMEGKSVKKAQHRLYQKKYRQKIGFKVKPNCPTCGYALQKMFINTPEGKSAHPNQMYCKICDKIVQV